MKVVGNFLIDILFLAVWHRVCRWILTKARRRPPSLVVSHLTSLVSGVFVYELLDGLLGGSSFAGGFSRVASVALMYLLPAQAVCFASDWLEQKRKRTLAPERPDERK